MLQPTTRADDHLQSYPAAVKHTDLAGLLGSIAVLRAAAAAILAAATCAKLAAAAAAAGAVPAPVSSLATPAVCGSIYSICV